ncbi:hypothetical protein AB0J83_41475 [Actinoplanes sp. NPDC049596]|uniref:hypothetical protein n=1 Tax=unclassified Actinoplanes TaxID=2626549 RepID=UPI00342679C0
MAMPAGITPITVTGKYLAADGTPLSGYLVFTPSIKAADSADNAIVPPAPYKVTLDGSGAFSVALMATDDPQWNDPGWTYSVREVMQKQRDDNNGSLYTVSDSTYNIEVPAASAGGTLDLADAVVVDLPGTPSQYLSKAGGTMTGDITLASGVKLKWSDVEIQRDTTDRMKVPDVLVVGKQAANFSTSQLDALPKGDGTGQIFNGIVIPSDYSGGDDDGAGGHYDSTGRVYTYAYQRANSKHLGENFRGFLMRQNAKHSHAIFGPQNTGTQVPGWDVNGDAKTTGVTWNPWFWGWVVHDYSNDGLSRHLHGSIETPMANGEMATRLQVAFGNRNTGTIGMDKTFIITTSADFVVNQASGETLRLAAAAGAEKSITFANDTYDDDGSKKRWRLRQTSTAEAGSNAGSDFGIQRFADDGSSLDSPFTITRSNGQITLGANSSSGVVIRRSVASSSSPALQVQINTATGSGVEVQAQAASDRALQSLVVGDASRRFYMTTDGGMNWGSGATSKDVTLYRKAADILATDDVLFLGGIAAPATQTGGGCLYVDTAGNLKFKSSAGNITTIAPV